MFVPGFGQLPPSVADNPLLVRRLGSIGFEFGDGDELEIFAACQQRQAVIPTLLDETIVGAYLLICSRMIRGGL